MSHSFRIDEDILSLGDTADYVFNRKPYKTVEITKPCLEKVQASYERLLDLVETGTPIYGVTTGFGDSCHRRIPQERGEQLQSNLVSYLLCGTGAKLSRIAARATLLIRLKSLCRGYSGVSPELIERMRVFVERGWAPVIPREGSLGASGDLIPLAYLARMIQGEGFIETKEGVFPAREAFAMVGESPYRLKIKEGLALVNGTSAMAGLSLVNWNAAGFLVDTAALSSAWLCLALQGRTEPFGKLVNAAAKLHPGQREAASWIAGVLDEEGYEPKVDETKDIDDGRIQDRYSLRCAPQILGPVVDTLRLVGQWLECEINSTSDNPLIDTDGAFAMGGNFYGGYLSQGMDYLKISLGHLADLADRQLMMLIDEKSNRGLPPNLANWPGLPEEERYLHHGLKGLHQSVGAITSEIMARTMPNGVFSRSSESHNQDKVSLGMSAATACSDILESLFTVQALYLICLAQALDLRGVHLQGGTSKELYQLIRDAVPFVERDMALEDGIHRCVASLKKHALEKGRLFRNEKA